MPVRLLLLSLPQLQALMTDPSRLDGLSVAADALPDFIVAAAVRNLEDGLPALWHAPFALLHGEPEAVVGGASFKGLPTDGRVEIGYGVSPAHEAHGIATAAVRDLLRIAFAEPQVREVYAECRIDNPASRRVLEKSGFRRIGQRESADDGLVDCWLASASPSGTCIDADEVRLRIN